MARDSERMNALVLDGFVPMQFTYAHVTTGPSWVLDQLRTALRPSPPECACVTATDVGRRKR